MCVFIMCAILTRQRIVAVTCEELSDLVRNGFELTNSVRFIILNWGVADIFYFWHMSLFIYVPVKLFQNTG